MGCLANLHKGGAPCTPTPGDHLAQQASQALLASLCPAGLLTAAGRGINDLNPFFMIDPSKDHKGPPILFLPLVQPPSHGKVTAASSGSLSEGA